MRYKIKNRKITKDGLVILNDSSCFKSLFVNPKFIESCICTDSEEVQQYNKLAKKYDLPLIKTDSPNPINHEKNQQNWFMPDEYKKIDICQYLISLCKTDEESKRISEELEEYKKRDLLNLLKYLKYFVENVRKNGLFLGVGRGSSVSSYVLYKLNVHKIDSLKYKLDYHEFLK